MRTLIALVALLAAAIAQPGLAAAQQSQAPVRTMHADSPSIAPVVPVVPDVQGTPGADVSEYEGTIDWAKLCGERQFVFIRASHGLHGDVTYAVNWSAAGKRCVLRGAYHYIDPTLPYAAQVRLFVSTVRLEKGDLVPVLDLESDKLWSHMKPADRVPYVLRWAKMIEHVYGVKPIIYLSPLFVPNVLGTQAAQQLSQYPLWIANYHVSRPTVPAPWTSYIIWQWAEDSTCSGVTGPCDPDIAPGGIASLLPFTATHAAGGDDKVLTADDLDDGGFTPHITNLLPPSDSQHGRTINRSQLHKKVQHKHRKIHHH